MGGPSKNVGLELKGLGKGGGGQQGLEFANLINSKVDSEPCT